MGNVTKWELESSPLIRRRMGKTTEECNELASVCARIDLQGIDSIDPSSGKPNRRRLAEEIGDVYAQLDECLNNAEALGIDIDFINERRARKRADMQTWEAMYK